MLATGVSPLAINSGSWRARVTKFRASETSIPFANFLGLRILRASEGSAEIAFESKQEHENSMHTAHGGALVTVLDVAMALAAASKESERGVVTVELKTSFLRPARGELMGTARVVHRGATIAFAEGHIVDADNRMCAVATGTFKYIGRREA
jgi:uncharacterized protein (TIGR00369 family)